MLVRSIQCLCGAVIGVVIPETPEESRPVIDELPVGWLGADTDGQVWDTRLTDTHTCQKCGSTTSFPTHKEENE